MSELLAMYDSARQRGSSHASAIRELSRRLDLDPDTLRRSLDRAERGASKRPRGDERTTQ